jgi:hypothetical protein
MSYATSVVRTDGQPSSSLPERMSTFDPCAVPDGRPPDDTDGARAWLHTCPEVPLDAVAHLGGPEEIVATFSGPSLAQSWVRRLLHETNVHRADAALAVRQPYELAPEMPLTASTNGSDGMLRGLGRVICRLRTARGSPSSPSMSMQAGQCSDGATSFG